MRWNESRKRQISDRRLDNLRAQMLERAGLNQERLKASMGPAANFSKGETRALLQELWAKYGTTVVRDYYMTTPLEVKLEDCSELTPYTLFLNKAGTIAHLIKRGTDYHTHFRFFPSVARRSDAYLIRLVLHRMEK